MAEKKPDKINRTITVDIVKIAAHIYNWDIFSHARFNSVSLPCVRYALYYSALENRLCEYSQWFSGSLSRSQFAQHWFNDMARKLLFLAFDWCRGWGVCLHVELRFLESPGGILEPKCMRLWLAKKYIFSISTLKNIAPCSFSWGFRIWSRILNRTSTAKVMT